MRLQDRAARQHAVAADDPQHAHLGAVLGRCDRAVDTGEAVAAGAGDVTGDPDGHALAGHGADHGRVGGRDDAELLARRRSEQREAEAARGVRQLGVADVDEARREGEGVALQDHLPARVVRPRERPLDHHRAAEDDRVGRGQDRQGQGHLGGLEGAIAPEGGAARVDRNEPVVVEGQRLKASDADPHGDRFRARAGRADSALAAVGPRRSVLEVEGGGAPLRVHRAAERGRVVGHGFRCAGAERRFRRRLRGGGHRQRRDQRERRRRQPPDPAELLSCHRAPRLFVRHIPHIVAHVRLLTRLSRLRTHPDASTPGRARRCGPPAGGHTRRESII